MINAEVLYLIGTLSLFAGVFVLFLAAIKGIRLWLAVDPERPSLIKGIRGNLILGGLLVLVFVLLPMDSGRETAKGVTVPVVWVLMSFPGWLTLFSAFMVV
ncbi:MAG: hypothetical protein MH204_10215, partial [Fimbriimonadaceae bacterium]|nr:hypothetical protein [Fimbriimonadaceae bacterium]